MRRWVADFETTTDEKDCRVWLWGVMDIENPLEFRWGRDIESFLEWCKNDAENGRIWFHNLKFDAQFIISKLLLDGWKWTAKKTARTKTFSSLITSRNEFYSMKLNFGKVEGKTSHVEIFDSLKLINMSVSKISKAFGLGFPKQEMDYNLERPKGYDPTPLELSYLNTDCKIVAIALKKLFDMGLEGITIGQASMEDFKHRKKNLSQFFVKLDKDIENDLRQAYKGGFTYLNPDKRDLDIGEGFFLDKNSMYPTQALTQLLPYGRPVLFKGKFEPNEVYKLCVQKISVVARLKEGKTPFLRSRTDPDFDRYNYVSDTHGDFFTTTLTNLEIDLLFENYDVDDIYYGNGWKFKASEHIFDEYMNYWKEQKEEAKYFMDWGKYTISKMMLNSLIGKFGARNSGRQAYPVLNDDDIVEYHTKAVRDDRKSFYQPVALFINSYARVDLIHTIEAIREFGYKKYGKDVYVYSDTDSICCQLPVSDLEELQSQLDLDDKRIGAWKLDKIFTNAKFLHSKCYMVIDESGVPHATIAGMPKDLANRLNMEQFTEGFSTANLKQDDEMLQFRALKQVLVKGGVVLVPTDYTL